MMKLSEIVKLLNLNTNVKKDAEILGIDCLANANKERISFCVSEKNIDELKNTKAAAVLIAPNLAKFCPKNCEILVCENPYLQFARLSKFFAKELFCEKTAPQIAKTATIMQNVFIGNGAKIGENSLIMSGVYIGENVEIAKNCKIYPNVVLYNDTKIADNCTIHANSVIGSDGFGYAHTNNGEHVKIYHNGAVILQENVEIGACCTVDRGVFGNTIIEKGSKIDNLVQIGHNCILGQNCILVSQVGLAGSSILGKNVVMGGQSATAGHLNIGDFAQIAARGGVTKSIKGAQIYGGYPILLLKDWHKTNAKIMRFFKDK